MHVPLGESVQKYFWFCVRDELDQFRALPFGLATAPREFTRLLLSIVEQLRREEVWAHAYLNGWLVRGELQKGSPQRNRSPGGTAQLPGLPKSDLVPRQHFSFLSMIFDLVKGTVAPDKKFLERIRSFLWSRRIGMLKTARTLHSLCGLLQHVASLVHTGSMHTRPLQTWLRSLLQFGDLQRSGVRDQEWAALHINQLEMEAVRRALVEFRTVVPNKTVYLYWNNTTAVVYIRKVGGTSVDYPT